MPGAGRSWDRRSPRREPIDAADHELVTERASLADAPALLLLQLEAPLLEHGGLLVVRQTLADAGAAVVVRDEECDPARLDDVVSGLLREPDRLERMGKAARGLGRADAAARVADLVEELAGDR